MRVTPQPAHFAPARSRLRELRQPLAIAGQHRVEELARDHLLGEHDFSAFRSSECQAKTPVRTLEDAVKDATIPLAK